MNRNVLVLLIACIAAGCAGTAPGPEPAAPQITPAQVQQQPAWGAVDNVTKVSRLYFSSQPDAAALAAARQAGVEVVINLRAPGETDFDEQAAAAAAGLAYYQAPVSRSGDSFDPEAMARIGQLVRDHPGQQVLLHCRTGQRATSWLAIHLAQDHQLTTQQSLEVAAAAGLRNETLIERVQRYLATP